MATHNGTTRSRLAPIIEDLRAGHIDARDAALARLEMLGELTPEESIQALEAAAESFPPVTEPYNDIGESLVRAATARPRPEHIDLLLGLFQRYSPRARGAVLQSLSGLRVAEAVETALDLIIGQISSTDAAVSLSDASPHSGTDPMLEAIMYSILLEYFKERLIPASFITRLAPMILAASRRYATLLRDAQRSQGRAWMWTEAYRAPRSNGALLLDILGEIPSPEAGAELHGALAYSDPYLKVFTILSLLRHGVVAPREHYEQVARSADTRGTLHTILRQEGRLDLFPKEFLTQSALAESDMVVWLTYPTELGKPPDAIELMAVRTIEAGPAAEDYYFFRFRIDDNDIADSGRWMAGVSGPFTHDAAPTASSGGSTFSAFTPWTDAVPDTYMKDLRESMEEE